MAQVYVHEVRPPPGNLLSSSTASSGSTCSPETRPQQVTFHLTQQNLQYWNTRTSSWATSTGKYGINVGDSSANQPLSGTILLRPSLRSSASQSHDRQPRSRRKASRALNQSRSPSWPVTPVLGMSLSSTRRPGFRPDCRSRLRPRNQVTGWPTAPGTSLPRRWTASDPHSRIRHNNVHLGRCYPAWPRHRRTGATHGSSPGGATLP